jgi:hypothetical protein
LVLLWTAPVNVVARHYPLQATPQCDDALKFAVGNIRGCSIDTIGIDGALTGGSALAREDFP